MKDSALHRHIQKLMSSLATWKPSIQRLECHDGGIQRKQGTTINKGSHQSHAHVAKYAWSRLRKKPRMHLGCFNVMEWPRMLFKKSITFKKNSQGGVRARWLNRSLQGSSPPISPPTEIPIKPPFTQEITFIRTKNQVNGNYLVFTSYKGRDTEDSRKDSLELPTSPLSLSPAVASWLKERICVLWGVTVSAVNVRLCIGT